jgi:hypothetical protein
MKGINNMKLYGWSICSNTKITFNHNDTDNEEYISPIIYHIEFYSADNGNKSNMSVIIDRENYKGDLLKQISDILNEGNIITSLKLAEDDE